MKKLEVKNNIIKCRGKCGLEKEANLDNFYWRKQSSTWKHECKMCIFLRQKELDLKQNPNKKRKKRRSIKPPGQNSKEDLARAKHEYYLENKEEIKTKSNNYRLNNKDKRNAYKRKNYKERYHSEPEYKLRHDMSTRISKMLKQNNSSKFDKSIADYLDYTFSTLVANIESKFEWWMNWNNRGIYSAKTWKDDDSSTWTWQIDHIIPHASLPYDSMEHPNFKKAWALENLRPYSAKQNMLDGASKIRHIQVPKCQ